MGCVLFVFVVGVVLMLGLWFVVIDCMVGELLFSISVEFNFYFGNNLVVDGCFVLIVEILVGL